MSFVHLHTHSHGSLLDGAQTTDTIAQRIKELNQPAVALTDHGNMHMAMHFVKSCQKEGVKPIVGQEFYQTIGSRHAKESIDGKRPPLFHLTLLVMNQKGLENIYKLSSLAFTEGFYYKPRVDYELLEQHSEGLIALSGCMQGRVQQLILASLEEETGGWLEKARKEIKYYQEIFDGRFYLELQRVGLEHDLPLTKKLIELSKETNCRCVATCDAHYARKEDAEFHDQLIALATGKTLQDEDRIKMTDCELYLKSTNEMLELFKDFPEAVANTVEVANRCEEVTLTSQEHRFPQVSDDDKALLRKKVQRGLWQLGCNENTVYTERAEKELKDIETMEFSSYFLVVSDFVDWSRKHDIVVGPGRGSACGSVVAYALGITEIDPIKYDLLWERFLNLGRLQSGEYPDIDLDFQDDKRDKVIKYLIEKYGRSKVAQIATYNEFKPRGAIRDFNRVQGGNYKLGDEASKLVPPSVHGREPTWERTLNEAPQLCKGKFKKITDMARKSENMVRQVGVHAAGVAVSDRELMRDVPLAFGRKKEIITQWDKREIEKVGLIKLDLLGLTALTTINKCLSIIKDTQGHALNLSKIPDNDSKTFDMICSGNTSGLFQFDLGSGIAELCVRLQPRSIEDLAVINAIYRPGPLASGVANAYVNRKNGIEPVTYVTPELEPILSKTYGLNIYQEQAMKIATDLAGYDLKAADSLRKAIGKKLPEEMKKHKEKMVSGMISNGIKQEAASKIFEEIQEFAEYSFNLSHAVAYSTITYRTAYLKTHYPLEFYCALLTLHGNERDSLVRYLADCRKQDLQVLPPDVNESDVDFTVYKSVIRFGLSAIKGLDKAAKEIVKARQEGDIPQPFQSISDFYLRCRNRGINKRVMETLAKVGAFDSFGLSRAAIIKAINELIAHSKELEKYNKKMRTYQKRMQRCQDRADERLEAYRQGKKPRPLLKLPDKPDEPAPPIIQNTDEMPEDELLSDEKELLGVYVSGHPLYKLGETILSTTNAHCGSLIDCVNGEHISLIAVISSVNVRGTKSGKNMALLALEDLHGYAEATVFTRLYAQCKDDLVEGNIVQIVGRIEAIGEDTRKILVTQLTKIEAPNTASTKKPQISGAEINIYKITPELLTNIHEILYNYQGNIPVEVIGHINKCQYVMQPEHGIQATGIEQLQKLQHIDVYPNKE